MQKKLSLFISMFGIQRDRFRFGDCARGVPTKKWGPIKINKDFSTFPLYLSGNLFATIYRALVEKRTKWRVIKTQLKECNEKYTWSVC